MYLFGYIRYIRPHIDYEETVLVGAGAVFVYFVFGLNALSHVRKPSMCSKRFGLMFV